MLETVFLLVWFLFTLFLIFYSIITRDELKNLEKKYDISIGNTNKLENELALYRTKISKLGKKINYLEEENMLLKVEKNMIVTAEVSSSISNN